MGRRRGKPRGDRKVSAAEIWGDPMPGTGGSHPVGERWQERDVTYTVNPTDDEKVEGNGHYLSMQDEDGNKATAVYNEDGTFADTKANKQWEN